MDDFKIKIYTNKPDDILACFVKNGSVEKILPPNLPQQWDALCSKNLYLPKPIHNAEFYNQLKCPQQITVFLCLCLFSDQQDMIGFLQARQFKNQCELDYITIANAYRAKGIAKFLMNIFFTLCKSIQTEKIYLEVSEKNTSAQHLYKHLGFNKIGLRKNYYADKTNAINMEKIL